MKRFLFDKRDVCGISYTRNQNTTLEIYRPLPWDQSYVTWNNRNYNTPWTNKGGDWFDRNNAAQCNSPYASSRSDGSNFTANSTNDNIVVFDIINLKRNINQVFSSWL